MELDPRVFDLVEEALQRHAFTQPASESDAVVPLTAILGHRRGAGEEDGYQGGSDARSLACSRAAVMGWRIGARHGFGVMERYIRVVTSVPEFEVAVNGGSGRHDSCTPIVAVLIKTSTRYENQACSLWSMNLVWSPCLLTSSHRSLLLLLASRLAHSASG